MEQPIHHFTKGEARKKQCSGLWGQIGWTKKKVKDPKIEYRTASSDNAM